jgi:hypothetical protein
MSKPQHTVLNTHPKLDKILQGYWRLSSKKAEYRYIRKYQSDLLDVFSDQLLMEYYINAYVATPSWEFAISRLFLLFQDFGCI